MVDNNLQITDSQNFFYGVCMDADDPLMLGRIRVFDTTDNIIAREKSSDKFDPNSTSTLNGIWSQVDPFVCLPLLPYFINQSPKKDEQVLIFYFNNKTKGNSDKYYVIAPYSSPTAVDNVSYKTSQTHLTAGAQYSRQDLPNIKDQDGKVPEKSKGVFAEPVDISFQGRDTTDIILKKNDVLLRAGKHKKFKRGEIPESDDKRAFLQLSKFNQKVKLSDPQIVTSLKSEDQPIKFLLEYEIINPENTQDALTGFISIYNLSNVTGGLTNVSSFDIDTNLSGITLSRAYFEQFQALPLSDVATKINEVITNFIKDPKELLGVDFKENANFPFYYRPTANLFNKITTISTNPNVVEFANIGTLLNLISVIPGDLSMGYGLVMNRNLTPFVPFKPVKEIVIEQTTEPLDNTVGIMGASDLYLISHDSTIPGKDRINLGSDTLYGIDPDKITTEMYVNTSSMVRGEELLELLDVIVNFLITHVHPYPLLPPSAVSTDGTSTDDVLKRMLEAYEKVLNKKIRIN